MSLIAVAEQSSDGQAEGKNGSEEWGEDVDKDSEEVERASRNRSLRRLSTGAVARQPLARSEEGAAVEGVVKAYQRQKTQSPASQDFNVPQRGVARGRERAARAPRGHGAATAPREAQRGREAVPVASQAAALPGESGNINGENHRGGQRGFALGRGRTAGAPGGRRAATAPRGAQRLGGQGALPMAPYWNY